MFVETGVIATVRIARRGTIAAEWRVTAPTAEAAAARVAAAIQPGAEVTVVATVPTYGQAAA
ncbi:MAG: hypothetical protein ACOYOQ_15415 [Microthrixaceae bacterium]